MRGRSRLALTRARLTQWRAQHGGRGIPVPEELWAEVVKVARVEGADTTARARALRLDRSRLEARMAMDRGRRLTRPAADSSSSTHAGSGCRRGRSFGFMVKMASGSRSSSGPGRRSIWRRWPKRSGAAAADDSARAADEVAGRGRAGRLPARHRRPGPHVPRSARRGSILGRRVCVPESTSDGDQGIEV